VSSFAEIESLFGRLLAAARSSLSDSECLEVQEFLDAREYGLALETLVGVYAEERKCPSSEVRDLIKQLAVAMSMDHVSLLRSLE
jgi:hypothetical protein